MGFSLKATKEEGKIKTDKRIMAGGLHYGALDETHF